MARGIQRASTKARVDTAFNDGKVPGKNAGQVEDTQII
jgi:hypothetical protein